MQGGIQGGMRNEHDGRSGKRFDFRCGQTM